MTSSAPESPLRNAAPSTGASLAAPPEVPARLAARRLTDCPPWPPSAASEAQPSVAPADRKDYRLSVRRRRLADAATLAALNRGPPRASARVLEGRDDRQGGVPRPGDRPPRGIGRAVLRDRRARGQRVRGARREPGSRPGRRDSGRGTDRGALLRHFRVERFPHSVNVSMPGPTSGCSSRRTQGTEPSSRGRRSGTSWG